MFTLIHDDCTVAMNSIKPQSIDLIIADPPYFLSNGGFTLKAGKPHSVDKGDWDSETNIKNIHQFNLKWLSQCQHLLKDHGTMWVFGTHHNIFSVGLALQELNFKILNHVIWDKINPPPNLSCRFFNFSFENIIWASKHKKSKYTFNYELIKRLNDNKQDSAIWKIQAAGDSSEVRFGKHTTQKPVKIMTKIIKASSHEHDVILDPFMGSGTAGVSATMLNREYIGIEQCEDYFKLAKNRITYANEQAIF
jgi:site-specific DNA-methyltransferase (adenine-specific)